MADFDDVNKLFAHLKNSLEDSLENDVADEMEYEAKFQIELDIYDAYQPTVYQRTYQLRDSITSKLNKNDKSLSLNIFHDATKIIASGLNQHKSIVNGDDVSSAIPEIVTGGKAPNIFNGSNYPWMHNRDYFKNLEERVKTENLLEKYLNKALNTRGIDTK